MKKYLFLDQNLYKKMLALLFIFFFLSFKYFSIILILTIAWLFLFRKVKYDIAQIRATDESIFLAPASGVVKVIDAGSITKIFLRMSFLQGYGISMPFSGDILSYFHTSEVTKLLRIIPLRRTKIIVGIKSDTLGQTKFIISRRGIIFHPYIWVRSGDKGLVGAYLGYLPFGGKIVIEIENDLNLIVKNKEHVQALMTLLASSRTTND